MARQKVQLAFIVDEKKRRATYKKRVEGFMKKVIELSTLCGIHVCAIVFSPYDAEPVVRPSPLGVQRVISQYHNLPDMEKWKNMLDQVGFLKLRIDKVNEQLRKKRVQNDEKRATEMMFECLTNRERGLQNLSLPDLNVLWNQIEDQLTEVNIKIKGLGNTTTPTPPLESSIPIEPPLPVELPVRAAPPARTPMLMAQQQFAPPPLEPLVPIVTNYQIQRNIGQVQGYNQLPQQFNNWGNQPRHDMVYGQIGQNQIIMPLTNNSTMAWPNASYDPTSAPNPYGFFRSS